MSDLVKKTMRVSFDNKQKPSMFLRNFFKKVQLEANKVELQGRTVKAVYSVDVKAGTGGRLFDVSKHETKDYNLPEYNDYSVITEDDIQKLHLGETEYTKAKDAAKVADLITDRQEIISDAQRRAEEKQASDALFQGQIALVGGDKIVFDKKATHTIDKSSAKWSNDSNDPIADIKDACKLCTEDGKIKTSLFNLILEDAGLIALTSNAKFKANSNYDEGIKRTDINIPEELTPGASFHGRFSAGSYRINLWTYNEKYEIPKGFNFAGEGTEVGYIPEGCGALLPDNPNFSCNYGVVNNVDASNSGFVAGAKLKMEAVEQLPYAYDVVDHGSAHTEAGVKSRFACIPDAVDTFATFKNLV